jgi:hypothetical protein
MCIKKAGYRAMKISPVAVEEDDFSGNSEVGQGMFHRRECLLG